MITYLCEHFLCFISSAKWYIFPDAQFWHYTLSSKSKMLQWNLRKISQRKKTFCALISIVLCHFGLKPVKPALLNFNTCFYSSVCFRILANNSFLAPLAREAQNHDLGFLWKFSILGQSRKLVVKTTWPEFCGGGRQHCTVQWQFVQICTTCGNLS